jgi:anion-transporting  ArsA/GET3 family ATPase
MTMTAKTNAQKAGAASNETDAALKANNDALAGKMSDDDIIKRGAKVGAALTNEDRERIRMINKKCRMAISATEAFIRFINSDDANDEVIEMAKAFNEKARRAITDVENQALEREDTEQKAA